MLMPTTTEQNNIKKWLPRPVPPQSLRQVDTLTCNAVRITYRDGKTALVICQQDGTITLMDDVEAC